MRRGVRLFVLGVVAAAFGIASTRAAGSGTATTTTTSTSTTTTPSYAPLAPSLLPAGCVGAGAAALVLTGHPVIALGTPASGLGPSAYFTSSGSVLAFDSSTSSGTTCKVEEVSLSLVSLFGGVVTASSVQARDGKGTVAGVEINGAAVTATPGTAVPVEGWGQLTLGATIGRVTAPLVLHLLQAHDSLPAGTAIAVAFAASAQPVARPRLHRHAHAHLKHAARTQQSIKRQRRQPRKPPPDYPASPYPFLLGGDLVPGAQKNAVVSTAMHYLGVPYKWAGASPRTGFDCSGLVRYVFAKLGVSLPYYAAAQWHSPDSVWVAPNQLRPGDLVFFTGSDGTHKAPGHVGIYVDDGYIIDAPHTGSSVRIDSLNEPWFANKYVGARRIVSQLLDTRHLLHTTKPVAPTMANPPGFPPPITIGPIGVSPAIAATGVVAVRTAAHTSALPDWTGVGLASVLLLLLPGAFSYRRRRRRRIEANASSP